MLLLIVLIAVPILEIAIFIEVGGFIGLWSTLGCVILTAIVGTVLLRQQGLQVLQKMQSSVQQQEFPVEAVIHGGFLLVSGLLLLTPGFFTDFVGFALLIPPVRLIAAQLIWGRLKHKVNVNVQAGPHNRQSNPGRTATPGMVIEGEAHEVPERKADDPEDNGDPENINPSSPWHR